MIYYVSEHVLVTIISMSLFSVIVQWNIYEVNDNYEVNESRTLMILLKENFI